MIYDFGTEITLTAPVDTTVITYSTGYDLKGGADGFPSLPDGENLYLQCEVTTAFAVGAGDPVPQFGVALSKTNPLTSDVLVLSMTGGTTAGEFVGFAKGQLTLGKVFHLPIPSWDDLVESASANWPNTVGATELAAFRDYRYLGLVCQNLAGTPASNDFSAGTIKARIIHRMGNRSPLTHTFASRMEVR